MSDTTSIHDLPTDPVAGGSSGGNIHMRAQEASSEMTLDQSTIQQIVNGLQQATLAGSTQLPSRDISMTTAHHNTDSQVMPNYVPPSPSDYIANYDKPSTLHHPPHTNAIDDMYNEMQMPILLIVLYFLFQLPFFKKMLYTYLPFLFSNDGNYNINGFLFTSVAFGMLFHSILKTTSYFGTF
jgi:hypothetical protein